MKATPPLVSLITLGAVFGFMIAATSCTSLISPGNQAKLDQASAKYETTTGISTGQTVSLLGKWWSDVQSAREMNKLLKSEPIPLGPIQATQAGPLTDHASAKAILENLNPQASATPSNHQRRSEGDTHSDGDAPEAPAPSRDRSKPRINEKSAAQMLASLGRHGPDRHPAAPGDQQTLATQPQLPAPAIVIPIVHYRQSCRQMVVGLPESQGAEGAPQHRHHPVHQGQSRHQHQRCDRCASGDFLRGTASACPGQGTR